MNGSIYYKLEENDPSFFIIVGLNHVKTGKATYINFVVGNVLAVDDSQYSDSARMHAPNVEDVNLFCKLSSSIIIIMLE